MVLEPLLYSSLMGNNQSLIRNFYVGLRWGPWLSSLHMIYLYLLYSVEIFCRVWNCSEVNKFFCVLQMKRGVTFIVSITAVLVVYIVSKTMVSSLANQDLRRAHEAGTCLVTPDWFELFGYFLYRTMVLSLANQDLKRGQEGGTCLVTPWLLCFSWLLSIQNHGFLSGLSGFKASARRWLLFVHPWLVETVALDFTEQILKKSTTCICL